MYLYSSNDTLPADVAAIQFAPSYTRISLAVLLKYSAPATSASPSLSTVGSAVLEPKYLSSNVSYADAADAALAAAAD